MSRTRLALRRSTLVLAVLLLTSGAMKLRAEEFTRPPAGVTIDETREVPLKAVVPSPCIAVSFTHGPMPALPFIAATVFLTKPEPAQVMPLSPGATETERLAWIKTGRSQELLALLPSSPDETGCFNIASDKLSVEVEFYVMDALERGTAVVKNTKTGEFVPHIYVRYFGMRGGELVGSGDISVHLPGKTGPLLISSWWES